MLYVEGEYLPLHCHPLQKSIAPNGHNEFLQGGDFILEKFHHKISFAPDVHAAGCD